ncbi:unnamed protein product [Thelazia callipaeda]|uniref:Ubiquitin carboxyl-terminal hydrolase n=1 Tax=Thelazia callipaeda TaxID=103827 RepID=A0A0N5CNP5_THECL|nr:unnamed protein product [Thelazia callipaeda]
MMHSKDSDEPVPSTLSESNNGRRTHFRLRSSNGTVGREFHSHSDVWHPAIDDAEMLENQKCPFGLTGLRNLGNTCYMNAAIQALSYCLPFSDFFRSLDSVFPFSSKMIDGNKEPPVSSSFRILLQALWSEERSSYINPLPFLVQFRHYCPQFRGVTQQDAQEFIRCLLDILHRELRQPVFAWEYRNVVCDIKIEASNYYAARSRYPPSRCSSRTSGGDDTRYETADSGWSSDGEIAPTSEEVQSEVIADSQPLEISDNSSDNQLSVEINQESKKINSPIYYRSLVTEVFDGQLRSTVKCLTCHNLSETYETFQDLSLSIPTKEQLEHIVSYARDINVMDKMRNFRVPSNDYKFWQWPWWLGAGLLRSIYRYIYTDLISLNDAFAAFFSPDDLCGDNMYSCEKCSKLRNGIKFCKIIKPPEILCIHLKRFRHDMSYSSKISTTVTFPIYDLDLTPFTETLEQNNESVLYDLVAFITHYGVNAESGHYVAYCKNEMNENWYEFDDSVVTKLEIAEVITKEAYVLFYQRQSSKNMDEIKNRVRQMLEEEMMNNTKVCSAMKAVPHHYVSREWLHRLSTFSNPGPITNHDFLCQHSQILPRRAAHLTDYYVAISSSLWDFFFEKFGGGPASSELHYCLHCQSEFQMMKHKRENEFKTFIALEARLGRLKADIPELTYNYYLPPNVIAKSWIDKWRAFVEDNECEPPGPIDNSMLLIHDANQTKLRLRTSQYLQLPREMWLFFCSIYGGGPELLCIPDEHPSSDKLRELIASVDEKIMENFKRLKNESVADMSVSSPLFVGATSERNDINSDLPCSDFVTDVMFSEN